MRLGTRVWSAGKLLLVIGALGATYLLFFAVSMRVAIRSREVEVPNLVGRTVNEATQVLADLDLGLRVDDNERPDDRVPAGRIMQQDPPAEVTSRRQRTIRVWVSSGPRSNIVPPLVGQTERTAEMRLEQDGLGIESISEFRSPDYSASVVAQHPPPNTRAARVALLLNRGEEATTYVMPDVIGTNGERAAEALRSGGFRVTIVGSQPYPGIPPGTVVRQQPSGGFRVAAAQAISLWVSQ